MNLLEDVQSKIEAGKTDKALADVQKALEKSPDDLDVKRAAATVYYQKMVTDFEGGNSDGAIKWYGDYYTLELPEDDTLHEQFKAYQRRIHPEFARMQEANKLSKSGKNRLQRGSSSCMKVSAISGCASPSSVPINRSQLP